MEKWKNYDNGIMFDNNNFICIDRIDFDTSTYNLLIYAQVNHSDIYEIIFEHIYCYKCTNESGIIQRLSVISNKILEKSFIYIIENSDYMKEYEYQSSGTRPLDNVNHYIILDDTDIVIEILSYNQPLFIKKY